MPTVSGVSRACSDTKSDVASRSSNGRVEAADVHAECRRPLDDASPHSPQPDDPEMRTAELAAEPLRPLERRVDGPQARPEVGARPRDVPGEHDHQRQRQLAHGLGVLARGRDDPDPALGGGSAIDIHRTAASDAHELQRRSGVEHTSGDRRTVHDQHLVVDSQQVDHLIGTPDVLVDIGFVGGAGVGDGAEPHVVTLDEPLEWGGKDRGIEERIADDEHVERVCDGHGST
jgi:hypothetical protein